MRNIFNKKLSEEHQALKSSNTFQQEKKPKIVRTYYDGQEYNKMYFENSLSFLQQMQVLDDDEQMKIQFISTILNAHSSLRSKITSEYIIEDFQVNYENESFFVFQELYQTTLKQICVKDLTFKEKVIIMRCIAFALKDLKKTKIVHTAINQYFIVIERDEDIKAKVILNENTFSLDQANRFQIVNEVLKNSVNHLIPPQLKNRHQLCCESDIWSAGVLFYFLLFGSFEGIRTTQKCVYIYFPPNFPSWLSTILEGMLALNPKQRITPNDLADFLKPALNCHKMIEKELPDLNKYRHQPGFNFMNSIFKN